MNKFEKYLLENKTNFIRRFRDDIKKDFDVDVPEGHGVTQSDFFHFGVVDGLKYVHKEALRFIFSNAGTYQLHEPSSKNLEFVASEPEKKAVENTIEKLFDFFRGEINEHSIYPEFIRESEKFFVFKYYSAEEGWGRINSLSRSDAKYIKARYKGLSKQTNKVVTPLYNQMFDKVFKNRKTGEIKFVDLKSFELRPKEKPMVYFYNGDVNDLYVLGVSIATRNKLVERFAIDYPVKNTRIKRYFF